MKTRFLNTILLGVLTASLAATPMFAQGRGKGHGRGNSDDDSAEGNGHGKGRGHRNDDDRPAQREDSRTRTRVNIVFSTRDRDVVTRYYARNHSNLPPGLAKRGGNLPPGLERQLERNGHLPPGLEKRMEPCPRELEREMAPLPEGHRRVIIGAKLLILNERTNVIVDVMSLVR